MFASGMRRHAAPRPKVDGAGRKVIASLPNKLSITGHTDATPFSSRRGYGNWELSTDRANASRATLVAAGVPPSRIAKVTGKADHDRWTRKTRCALKQAHQHCLASPVGGPARRARGKLSAACRPTQPIVSYGPHAWRRFWSDPRSCSKLGGHDAACQDTAWAVLQDSAAALPLSFRTVGAQGLHRTRGIGTGRASDARGVGGGRLSAQPQHRVQAALRWLQRVRSSARAGQGFPAESDHAPGSPSQRRRGRPYPAGSRAKRAFRTVPALSGDPPQRQRHGSDGLRRIPPRWWKTVPSIPSSWSIGRPAIGWLASASPIGYATGCRWSTAFSIRRRSAPAPERQ